MKRLLELLNTWKLADPLTLAGMFIGMALIYRTVSLPWIAVGLVIFGALALARPALALLFVPLSAPWYLSPVYIPDIRASGFVLPLQEMLLLMALGGAAIHGAVSWARARRAGAEVNAELGRLAPHGLVLIAGVVGVAIAIERGAALRDFRWMVLEPLLFYMAALYFQHSDRRYLWKLAGAFVVSGTFVAALGLLQRVGVDLVPTLLSPTKSYADSVVQAGDATRVASVYGHPNNLGMYLGRVWPVALALALGCWVAQPKRRGLALALAGAALLCLAGLVVSLSRGAWLGAMAAMAILAIGWLRGAKRGRAVAWVIGLGGVVVILAGLVISLRGGLGGGSADVRLLFWGESIDLILRHPIGLGLDQFYYYHNPEFGRSLIDPSLIGTSEQYAKHPHNLILELWLLLTPLGLIAIGWVLRRFFRESAMLLADRPRNPIGLLALGAAAAMGAAVVHGLVDSFYFWPDLAYAFWLLVVLVDTARIKVMTTALFHSA